MRENIARLRCKLYFLRWQAENIVSYALNTMDT